MTDEHFCPVCGCDIFECNGAGRFPDGLSFPCSRTPDRVPGPVTLPSIQRPGRSGALGWLLLGLVVGLMVGLTLFCS